MRMLTFCGRCFANSDSSDCPLRVAGAVFVFSEESAQAAAAWLLAVIAAVNDRIEVTR